MEEAHDENTVEVRTGREPEIATELAIPETEGEYNLDTVMEAHEENTVKVRTGREPEIGPELGEEDNNQTNVQEAQVDICSDQETAPSSTFQTQDAFIPHEEETTTAPAEDVGDSTATIKILLMPEGHMMTVAFKIGLTTQDLKNHFANELRVSSNFIQITLNGNAVEDDQTLISLGVQPHATVQFEMSSLDPENYPIKPIKPQQEYNMPDVITVRVQTDAGISQDVVVEIERAIQKKPFLGGYRHKLTKTEYHHAGVQTVPKKRPDKGVEIFNRDTQTVNVKSQTQQSIINTCTQMTRPGCFISNMENKLITPRRYITADEYHSKRLNAVITIQTHTRRWLAERRTSQLRLKKETYLAWVESEKKRKKEEKEEQIRADCHSRMNPEKKDDFGMVFNGLEEWREEEVKHIDATLCGAERKAALCALLEKQRRVIEAIECHRIAAREKQQEMAVQALLNKSAASKQWQATDKIMVQMDTLHIIRARELRDLYFRIILGNLSQEERLDVLLTVKHTVKEHDCKLTHEIIELIDREADLLMRSVKESNLKGLRKRIATLFLQYIRNPTFNPQVSKFLPVPQDPEQPMKKHFNFCPACNKFLPSSDFFLTVSSRTMGVCRHCKDLENEARHRKDFSRYKTILKSLRSDESKFNPDAKIPFFIQVQDIQYLVDVVWGSESALSAWNDLNDLLMVRWDRHRDWSPWNCILLTKDEAAAHLKVKDIEKTYDAVFISNVKRRHAMAQKHFSRVYAMVRAAS